MPFPVRPSRLTAVASSRPTSSRGSASPLHTFLLKVSPGKYAKERGLKLHHQGQQPLVEDMSCHKVKDCRAARHCRSWQRRAQPALLRAPGLLVKHLGKEASVCGAIYVGPKDDFGWNQGHAEGVAAIKKLANIRVVEEENVPETIEVQKSMESMINLDKAELIFATSFGYWDHMLKVAAKYPKVQFVHAGPTVWKEGMPQNAGSYNGFIDEAQYVAGVVAGGTSKTGKLGFVGAKPYPAVPSQHQFIHTWCANGQSQCDHPSHIHRRLGASGKRG